MYALLIFLLLYSDPSPDIKLFVSRGAVDFIPARFEPLEQLKKTEIGESYWIKVKVWPEKKGEYVLQGGNWYMRNLLFFDSEGARLGSGNHISVVLDKPSTFFIFYEFPDEKDRDLFTVTLQNEIPFLKKKYEKDLRQYVFHAILIFLIGIALFFGISSSEKVYYYYSLYLFSIIWFFGYQYGLLGRVLPFVNEMPPMWFWLMAFTLTFFYVVFANYFMDVKNNDPIAYRLYKWGLAYMVILFMVSSLLYLLGVDVQHSYGYKIPVLVIQLGLIGAYLYRLAFFKGIVKRYFFASAAILLIISIGGQLHSTFRLVDDFNNVVQAGLISEVFILTLGLGVRVYQIQKVKNQAQQKYIDQLKINEQLQKNYSEELEGKVRERTEKLNKRNKENEVLLKEIHHRVKNNLQMITSLINIQQRRTIPEASEALLATKRKIRSISLIHEHLYKSSDISKITLKDYVNKLTEMIIESFKKEGQIKKEIRVSHQLIDIEVAIMIGLILNELITNSLKYAFSNNSTPILGVHIETVKGRLELIIMDNGPGIKNEVHPEGLGYSIIRSIIMNHEGDIIKYRDNDNFCVKVTMKA